jgi:hypothetical protein
VPHPPHIDRILKLLLLGGRGNPSEHEREAARAKAEVLMARDGVTLQEMRDLYRREQGLPPRPGPGPAQAPARQGRPRAGRAGGSADPEGWDQFMRESRERAPDRPEDAERAGRRKAEREQLTQRLRAAILQALGLHLDFADFFDHLAGQGIQASMATDDAMERIVYRWPPEFQVAVAAGDLGEGCDWPSLLRAGLRFDPLDPRHRDARAMMAMT